MTTDVPISASHAFTTPLIQRTVTTTAGKRHHAGRHR